MHRPSASVRLEIESMCRYMRDDTIACYARANLDPEIETSDVARIRAAMTVDKPEPSKGRNTKGEAPLGADGTGWAARCKKANALFLAALQRAYPDRGLA